MPFIDVTNPTPHASFSMLRRHKPFSAASICSSVRITILKTSVPNLQMQDLKRLQTD
jgi:hypothetical protein